MTCICRCDNLVVGNFITGELTFAITAASKIYVNLKMDNITALLHKFSKKSVHIVTIASGNSSNVPNAQAMFENRMTVA